MYRIKDSTAALTVESRTRKETHLCQRTFPTKGHLSFVRQPVGASVLGGSWNVHPPLSPPLLLGVDDSLPLPSRTVSTRNNSVLDSSYCGRPESFV